MLSDEEREELRSVYHNGSTEDLLATVERIASDAARAAERALVERIEAVLDDLWRATDCGCGHRADLHREGIGCTGGLTICACRTSFSSIVTRRLRAALRPEAATTERRWDECLHGVTLGSVCLDCPSKWASIPARPAATTEEEPT